MFKRTPERKRKRLFKRAMEVWLTCLAVLGIAGVGVHYLFTLEKKKPLYISPLGITNQAASGFVAAENTDAILEKRLKEKNIAFDAVSASGSAYIVRMKDGGVVLFSSEKNLESQVSSLQFVLSRLTMEGRIFKQLDMRFDKPVVVLK